MSFKVGQNKPVKSGIKKGQKQMRTVIRHSVLSLLQGMGKHPVTELQKLLPELEPRDQARVWMELLKYVAPQLSAQQITDERVDDQGEDPIDVTPMSTDELLNVAKSEGDE